MIRERFASISLNWFTWTVLRRINISVISICAISTGFIHPASAVRIKSAGQLIRLCLTGCCQSDYHANEENQTVHCGVRSMRCGANAAKRALKNYKTWGRSTRDPAPKMSQLEIFIITSWSERNTTTSYFPNNIPFLIYCMALYQNGELKEARRRGNHPPEMSLNDLVTVIGCLFFKSKYVPIFFDYIY
jgi:hypothetical protein